MQLIIESFKYGLDTRRSFIASQPGTLATLNNGVVNQGGEIKKRLAFVPVTPGGAETTPLPENSFGLIANNDTVYVFGSEDRSAFTFPSYPPIIYQRLQHPAALAGAAPDPHFALTEVLSADLFGGYPFVIAKFNDNRAYAYYNGALVHDFTDGIVLEDLTTNDQVAQAITDAMNRTGSFTATRVGAVVTVTGPTGFDWSSSSSETSALGTLSNGTTTQEARAFVPGAQAVAAFKIMAGSVGAAVTSATGTITRTATNAANGESITIGNKKYTWRTTITTEGDVHIKASAALSLAALKDAINHTGTPGTDYICFGAHPNVVAGTISGNNLPLTAGAGSSGNSVALVEAMADWTVSGALFTGGAGNCVAAVNVVSLTQVETPLMGTAVAFTSVLSVTATAVAQEINNNTSAGLNHGYTASASDNTITILAPITASPVPNNYVLKVVAGGNVCIGDCMFYFVLTGASFQITDITAGGQDIVNGATYTYPTPGTYDTFAELYAKLETDINAQSGVTGVVARASTDYMQVSKLVTRSDDAAYPVNAVFLDADDGQVIFGVPSNQPGAFVATIPSFANLSSPGAYRRGFTATPVLEPVTVQVVGGVGPYTYDWVVTSSNKPNVGVGSGGTGTQSNTYDKWIIGLVADGVANVVFDIRGFEGQGLERGTYTAKQAYVCQVTDSQGRRATSTPITVNIIV